RVVVALALVRVPGQAAALAQPVEAVLPAGHHFVYVRLMPGVEEQTVLGRFEDPVQRQGELDHTEVRAEVAAGPGYLVDEEVADLRRERLQLLGSQSAQVLWPPNILEPTVAQRFLLRVRLSAVESIGPPNRRR